MCLPHLNINLSNRDESLVKTYSFTGFSFVRDALETTLAFSRSTAENSPYVVDQPTGARARLVKGRAVVKVT